MGPVEEFRALGKRWPKLSLRLRSAILVMAGVYRVPTDARPVQRTPKGETPHWLPTALTLLKDARVEVSDREIARRLGIAPSTLTRSEVYQRAKKTYAIRGNKPVLRFRKRPKPQRG